MDDYGNLGGHWGQAPGINRVMKAGSDIHRHAEAQMRWWSCRYPSRRGSAQTKRPSVGS